MAQGGHRASLGEDDSDRLSLACTIESPSIPQTPEPSPMLVCASSAFEPPAELSPVARAACREEEQDDDDAFAPARMLAAFDAASSPPTWPDAGRHLTILDE